MAQAKRGAEMWIVKEHNQRCSVQRLGHKDGDPAFSLRGYKQATALVERLNRLDRAEVALQRLADAVQAERITDASDDISVDLYLECVEATDAAEQAAREVLR
jgi:hypothetical protein